MQKTTKEHKGELIYGIHAILEVLKARKRKIIALYTTRPEPKAWPQIRALLPNYVQIQYVGREILTKMAETSDHQGFVAWVHLREFRKKFFNPVQQKFLVLLDSIQDTRNVGAILRSAYCAAVDGIILCKKQGAPLNASSLKASAGLAEHLEIYEAPSIEAAVVLLKEAGYTNYLATLGGADAMSCIYQEPLCLVIGNEATGISKNILKSGIQITLRQQRPDISYNASVAAGILLFLIGTKNSHI
jgi:23S rRNA (guanosine2251-2'-O)-methyltransferase